MNLVKSFMNNTWIVYLTQKTTWYLHDPWFVWVLHQCIIYIYYNDLFQERIWKSLGKCQGKCRCDFLNYNVYEPLSTAMRSHAQRFSKIFIKQSSFNRSIGASSGPTTSSTFNFDFSQQNFKFLTIFLTIMSKKKKGKFCYMW